MTGHQLTQATLPRADDRRLSIELEQVIELAARAKALLAEANTDDPVLREGYLTDMRCALLALRIGVGFVHEQAEAQRQEGLTARRVAQ